MTKTLKIAGFSLAAGAAALIALSAPAIARGQFGGDGAMGMRGPMGGPGGGLFAVQFSDLDADGDGLVTEAELTARAEALAADRLAGIDTDGDGAVSAAEIEAGVLARIEERVGNRMGKGQRAGDPAERAATMAARMLEARDADGDGVLSGDELSPGADVAALIDRFDTDDDNAWSAEEFAQVGFGKGGFGDRGGKGDRGGRGDRGDRGGKSR